MQLGSVMAYLNRLKDTKLACGKTLLELTTYKEVALWWFADVAFYYYLFDREYANLGGGTGLGSKIWASGLFKALVRGIYYFSDYFLAVTAYLVLLQFNRMKQVRTLGQEDKVILITGEDIEWRTFYTGDRVEPVLSDQFFHAIIHELNETEKYRIVSTYPLKCPYASSIRVAISKCRHWDVLHIPFHLFFQPGIGRERSEAKHHFRRVWGLLKDDKKLQNADNLLPVVNAGKAGGKKVAAALAKLTDVLTTEDLTDLNRKVDAERQKPKDVAEDYLKSKNLL